MYVLNGSLSLNNTALTQSDSAGGQGGTGGPVGVGAARRTSPAPEAPAAQAPAAACSTPRPH